MVLSTQENHLLTEQNLKNIGVFPLGYSYLRTINSDSDWKSLSLEIMDCWSHKAMLFKKPELISTKVMNSGSVNYTFKLERWN